MHTRAGDQCKNSSSAWLTPDSLAEKRGSRKMLTCNENHFFRKHLSVKENNLILFIVMSIDVLIDGLVGILEMKVINVLGDTIHFVFCFVTNDLRIACRYYINFSFFQSKYSLMDRVTEYHSIMTHR